MHQLPLDVLLEETEFTSNHSLLPRTRSEALKVPHPIFYVVAMCKLS